MALIKCPECGGNVSDKAYICIHCGYPISPVSINTRKVKAVAKSVAIIYGIQDVSSIDRLMMLYIDGEYFTFIRKWDRVEIPIERDCVLTVKLGLYKCECEDEILLKAGRTTKVQIIYDKRLCIYRVLELHES